MKWDTVVLSIRVDQDVQEARKMMKFLQECGMFETDHMLVVSDPCDDVGSAGSALNALLNTAEHLCASRGLSVLNESLLESSKILILLLGASSKFLPLGAAFLVPPDNGVLETPWIAMDCPIANAIRNINMLAENVDKGVWICGTDALWEIVDAVQISCNDAEIAAFCFEGNPDDCHTHGVFDLGDENIVKSIDYKCDAPKAVPKIVLGLIYLPPSISTRFLSLYSVYPISRSTYYGVDSGAIGLKLSLFFDLILATCLSEEDFISTHVFEKSEKNIELLKHSRKEIWKRFHHLRSRAYCLPIKGYEYLGSPGGKHPTMTSEAVIHHLRDVMSERIRELALSQKQYYTTAVLKTAIACNSYCKDSFNIFKHLEKVCVESVPNCARALMLTAEFLALSAHGKGGLRSGPAANPTFSLIFEAIKKNPEDTQNIIELYQIIEEKWMRSENDMIRAARHLEGAAQIYTQIEVKRICEKYIPSPETRPTPSAPKSFTVEAAARIDLFGGWLDTPPITLHARPSAVVNMAITVDGRQVHDCLHFHQINYDLTNLEVLKFVFMAWGKMHKTRHM
ncbi:unnamed protein product [Cylicocyclus nassatus]|uniref:GDP-fucose pyrophosphorylase domain-containing protein n=1 Tax=Cylicocyclus nassatus TaxID=53992 RepID=A0AA36HD32_CYLNA|nr:unnamed protein product [Cylicocyclus nassatus]